MSSACPLRARERLDFDYIVSHFKMSKADKKERKAEERAGGLIVFEKLRFKAST